MTARRSTRELFSEVRERVAEVAPVLADVKLRRCPVADHEHEKSERQFMHVGCKKDTICYAGAVNQLGANWKTGLLVHEMGHLAAFKAKARHTEQDANDIGSDLAGINVEWRGPLHLEWARAPKRRR